jgi:ribokinase
MHAFVIGNVTIDETILVDEMPSPGASILGQIGQADLGGKGANQAVVLGRCCLPTTLIAPVGKDARAAMIRQHLNDEPLETILIELAGKASDASLVFRLPDGENSNVTTTASAQNLRVEEVQPHLALARAGDIAILQGNLSETATYGILEHAKTIGMRTAFNPSPLRPYFADLWQWVDIVFLNRGEAQALTGATGREAAEHFLGKGVREVVMTSGREGAVLMNARGTTAHAPAVPCDVVDTTGAGDTFMSVALASAALRNCDLDQLALQHAAQAAAITVSQPGTRSAFPTIQQLQAVFKTSLR